MEEAPDVVEVRPGVTRIRKRKTVYSPPVSPQRGRRILSEPKDVKVKKLKVTEESGEKKGGDGEYFHSHTGLKREARHLDYDSEDEDLGVIFEQCQRKVEEETGERGFRRQNDFMNMWNAHQIRTYYKFNGDIQAKEACLDFVRENYRDIIGKKLAKQMMIHLQTMFQFGIISMEEVHEIVSRLRKT